MKYLSVCSGIEAATMAWHGLGWATAGFSEIEPFPCKVLAHHYPGVPNYGDMTKFKEWPIEPGSIDLLVGGTPCQSFSVAGLRKGLEDPRGNLMLTFGAIAGHLKPTWVVWENVPGVLSSNGGRDFGSFLGMLGELGYGFAYRVLDAQYVRTYGHSRAVPQRRRRVFVVGYLGDWRRAASVLFEPESLSGYPPPSRETGESVALPIGIRVDRGGSNREAQGNNLISPTLRAKANSSHRADMETFVPFAFEPRTPDGYARVTGGGIAPTLNRMGGGQREPCVAMTLNAKGGADRMDGESETLLPIGFEANMSQQHPSEGNVFQTITRRTHASVAGSFGVRRLTPKECERLQGFPDNFTLVPVGKGMAKDGPRYKALGNSMATNAMEWLGMRIDAEDRNDPLP